MLIQSQRTLGWTRNAYLITYLSSFEILARMAKTSPIIPYELSKYLMCGLLLLGIAHGSARGRIGWWLLLLLVPALLFDQSGQVSGYQPIVFNLLGPFNAALSIVFFTRQSLDTGQFRQLLLLLLYPLLSVLVFTYVRTPDYDEIKFSLSANFATAGGFGSNQVSTVLGLGMFLVFLFWLNRWQLTGSRWVDALLLFVFTFEGLLTFSRGGMIGGVLGILLVLFVLFRSVAKLRKRYRLPSVSRYLAPVVLLSAGAFGIANNITGGLLTLRYQGETAGTSGGYREKTINVITSNRYDIFIGDLALWTQHPILGVGVGASRYLRDKVNGVVAHVELSRLLAEHGVLGFIYFVLLLWAPLQALRRNHNPLFRSIQMALFIIAIYTTFHAAMRTYVTPLLVGISTASVVAAGVQRKKDSSFAETQMAPTPTL